MNDTSTLRYADVLKLKLKNCHKCLPCYKFVFHKSLVKLNGPDRSNHAPKSPFT